jgi:hypothetical protein
MLFLAFPNLPVEFASQILELCSNVLSGIASFPNEEEGFEVSEAAKNLCDALFENLDREILLMGLGAAMAKSTDSHIPFLVEKLKEYMQHVRDPVNPRLLAEIEANLEAFHPQIRERIDFPRPTTPMYNEMADSIARLMDPETVFEEMESLIAKRDPNFLENYPLYLRGFLQRSYVLYTRDVPEGISDANRELAERMIASLETMSTEDLIGDGAFSVDTLSARLESLKTERRQFYPYQQ